MRKLDAALNLLVTSDLGAASFTMAIATLIMGLMVSGVLPGIMAWLGV